MSKDNKYLSSYVPEVPKKIANDSIKKSYDDDNKIAQIEEALSDIQESMEKSNRDNLDAMYNIDTDNLSPYFKKLLAKYSTDITQAQASIEAWAGETRAGFEAVARWQTEFESKEYVSKENLAASIGTYLNGEDGQATIVSAVSGQFVTKDTLTGYVQTNQLSAAITQAVDQYESKLHLSVANNDKSSTISLQALQNGSYVTISSDTITLAGEVVFKSDLSTKGATTINGENIETGTLKLQEVYYKDPTTSMYHSIISAERIANNTWTYIGPKDLAGNFGQYLQLYGTQIYFSSPNLTDEAFIIDAENRVLHPSHDAYWSLGKDDRRLSTIFAIEIVSNFYLFDNVTSGSILFVNNKGNLIFTDKKGNQHTIVSI